MIVGTAVKGGSPYREVLSHGYVCDSKGEKMSKSVGNVVNPMDIINTNGADVFRLWAMNADYKQDLKLGNANIKQVSDQYRKIRNTFRFLLGNINAADFDPKKDMLGYDELTDVDRYILVCLNDVVKEFREDILAYDYLSANKALMNFMVNELSAYYCDFTKDILYCDAPDALRRRQVQSVYWQCTDALVKMWAPFLCYTAEEVWKHFSNDEEPSVHYTDFPAAKEYADAEELKAKFHKLLKVRDAVNKSIENARNEKMIGTAQEAEVTILCSDEEKALIEGTLTNVPQWFIVSKVSFKDAQGEPEISRAPGVKCPRCWNYSEEADEDGLCPRCHAVMAKRIER